METDMRLYKKHPTLFRTVFLIGLTNLVIALFTLFDSPRASISFTRITSIPFFHQPAFWIVIFGLAGIMCMHGAFTSKYAMARVGLVLSAAIGSFLAIGFWLSYFSANIVGISAPVIWMFYTIICIINSSEPDMNPLSAVLQQDIHRTLLKGEHEKEKE